MTIGVPSARRGLPAMGGTIRSRFSISTADRPRSGCTGDGTCTGVGAGTSAAWISATGRPAFSMALASLIICKYTGRPRFAAGNSR